MKRFNLIILVVIYTLSAVFSQTPAFAEEYGIKIKNPSLVLPQAASFEENGGALVLEAEDLTLDLTAVSVVKDEAASGGKAIATLSTLFEPDVTKISKSSVEMKIKINNPNTYYVWMRVGKTAGADSFYYRFDDNGYATHWGGKDGGYGWLRICAASLTEGEHSFDIKYRKPNYHIDKIALSSDLSYVPVEMNDDPPVSETASGGTLSLEDWPKPDVYPIAEHPRLYVTKADIPQMKENASKEPMKTAWNILKQQVADKKLTGILPDTPGNYDEDVLNKIMARALMTLMGEETDMYYARDTIEYAKNYMQTVTFPNIGDITRQMGRVMVMGAIVYDWCYDYMSDSDKQIYIQKFKDICAMKEIGYPPGPDVAVAGHGMEAEVFRDALSAGIACYDEDPEMYLYAAGTYFGNMLKTAKYINQSGKHPTGNSYGPVRFGWEVISAVLFERMGYGNLMTENVERIAHYWQYNRLPEGITFSEGDDWIKEFDTGIYYSTYYHQSYMPLMALTDDPYIKAQWLRDYSLFGYANEPFWEFVYAAPEDLDSVEPKFEDDLPLTLKTNYPFTSLVARTSWQTGLEANTAMAYMHASERNIFDHSHRDVGQFQIYYKGLLAMDSGAYDSYGSNHDYNYAKRSASHNVITVYDPDEKFYYKPGLRYLSNDGGQRHTNAPIVTETLDDLANNDEFKTAETKSVYVGPNEKTPEFSYIKTNLKPAYSEKVTDYKRSMVFMDLNNTDYPAAFIVYDKIDSSNPEFKKTWMLHCAEEPTVNGKTSVIERKEGEYNGKLVVKTMLPEKSNVAVVGGKDREFTAANGINYATLTGGAGAGNAPWQIDVTPSTNQKEDVFLHAMYVTDADGNLAELPMEYGSTATHETVTIMDRMVMFSKDSENISTGFNISVTGNNSEMTCLIADVAPGKWLISGQGISIIAESKEAENCLYVKLPQGNYTVAPADAGSAVTAISAPEMTKEKIGDFRIYKAPEFMYLPSPTKEIDGAAYISANKILPLLGAQVNAQANSVTAVKNGETAVFTADSSTYTYQGAEVNLKSPCKLINGEVYVPATEINGFLNSMIRYDSYGKILYISEYGDKKNIEGLLDTSKIVSPVGISAIGNDGNAEGNAFDFNLATRWSCEGVDKWLEYDFGEVVEFNSVKIAFHQGTARKSYFDLQVSEDGENYTTIYSGESSGESDSFETFDAPGTKARYLRYVGDGNSMVNNFWNSVLEMIPMK